MKKELELLNKELLDLKQQLKYLSKDSVNKTIDDCAKIMGSKTFLMTLRIKRDGGKKTFSVVNLKTLTQDKEEKIYVNSTEKADYLG